MSIGVIPVGIVPRYQQVKSNKTNKIAYGTNIKMVKLKDGTEVMESAVNTTKASIESILNEKEPKKILSYLIKKCHDEKNVQDNDIDKLLIKHRGLINNANNMLRLEPKQIILSATHKDNKPVDMFKILDGEVTPLELIQYYLQPYH